MNNTAYMAYGKSFSNNYLEQKRVNNHNTETYMLVKADFPAIVTEEEWYQCEKIRKSRRADLNIPTTRKTNDNIYRISSISKHLFELKKYQLGMSAPEFIGLNSYS